MPLLITKGDHARPPKLCEEIVARRAHYKKEQARVAYLEMRGDLNDAEQAEKTLKEEALPGLQVKIASLYHQVKSTAAADLANIAAVAEEDHLVTKSAMAGASTNRTAALKEAEKMVAAANRHLKTLVTGDALDAATRVCHDKEGRTINRMMDMTDTTAVDGGGTDEGCGDTASVEGCGDTASVEGGGDTASGEGGGDAAAVEIGGDAAAVEGGGDTAEERMQRAVEADIVQTLAALIEEDAAAVEEAVDAAFMDDGDGLYEPAIEPKPKAKPRARAKAKANAEPPLGALICGRGSCAFWTLRQASMTTHRAKNCKGEVPVNFVDDKPSKNTRAAKRARTKKDKDDTAASSTPAAAVPVAAVPVAAVPVAAVPVDTYESAHEMQTRLAEEQQDEVRDRFTADRFMQWVREELDKAR